MQTPETNPGGGCGMNDPRNEQTHLNKCEKGVTKERRTPQPHPALHKTAEIFAPQLVLQSRCSEPNHVVSERANCDAAGKHSIEEKSK